MLTGPRPYAVDRSEWGLRSWPDGSLKARPGAMSLTPAIEATAAPGSDDTW
jgi:hypothetical protein